MSECVWRVGTGWGLCQGKLHLEDPHSFSLGGYIVEVFGK